MGRSAVTRIRGEETGVVMVVVVAVLMILGLIAASVLTTAIAGKRQSANDRFTKQAYGAALAGVQAAAYRLNATKPGDNVCPPLPGQTTPVTPSAAGLCGPYASDDPAAPQPMVSARYEYWITPVMTTASNGTHGYTPDVCVGAPPPLLTRRILLVVQERCITAVGQALSGGTVRSSSRVQLRVSSAKPFFPIPGVWGTQCVNISGGSISPGNVGCSTTTAIGSNTIGYNGTLGSNGQIYAGMRAWGVNPNTATPADPPANVYLGYKSPTTTQTATYSFKINDSATLPATCPPGGSAGSGGGTLTFESTDINPTNGCMPYPNNAPILFGEYFALPLMTDYFGNPPGAAFPTTPATPTGVAACSTTTDTASCNDNLGVATAVAQMSATCQTGAWNASTRVLVVKGGCTMTLPTGIYNFCSVTLGTSGGGGGGGFLIPSNPAGGSSNPPPEVRIFLDSRSRAGSGCTAASAPRAGSNITFNATSGFGTTDASSTSPACSTAAQTVSAASMQLYVYGAGDPALTNGVPYRSTPANDSVDIDNNAKIYALVEAPNSTVNINQTGGCVRGGLAADGVNVPNNAAFFWDTSADLVTGRSTPTQYRRAFAVCSSRYDATLPMDGC
jgi:type II secretory pathway pseudopilin PulG